MTDVKNMYDAVQTLMELRGTRYYGDEGTIHSTNEVNVELDKNGKVVSVWFRCCALPFTQHVVDDSRADSMREMYTKECIPALHGIEVKDKK